MTLPQNYISQVQAQTKPSNSLAYNKYAEQEDKKHIPIRASPEQRTEFAIESTVRWECEIQILYSNWISPTMMFVGLSIE